MDERGLDISVVDLCDLFGDKRLDAEFYNPKYLSLLEDIETKDNQILSDDSDDALVFITDGEHGSPEWDETSGIKYITAENIGENFINEASGFRSITKGQDARNARARVQPDDVLLYSVGVNLGLAAQAEKQLLPANIPRSVALLRVTSSDLLPGYLSTFLNTKYGKFQTERLKAGNAQPMLALEKIKKIKIPIPSKPFQEKIAELVQEAHRERERSKVLYAEAEEILLDELGLKDWQPSQKNTAIKDSEEVRFFGRADAEFFQPKYDELFEKLKVVGSSLLSELADYAKGVEPGSDAYTDSGTPFVRVSDVSINGIEDVEKYISNELAQSYGGKFSPKKGEVLFTKDGTIGTSFVVNEDLDVVLSGAFLRLMPKTYIEVEYLALVLNSIVCKLQIERFAGGAIIAHLKPSDAMNLQIPIVDPKIQQKIAEKIRDSHTAREKSKVLLAKAKLAVETFVEHDEKTAQRFV